MAGLGIGALIWLCLLTLVSLFAGGWVAGRMAGPMKRVDSMLHGVITWGVVTLVALFTVGSAVGGLLSGTANILGGTLSAAGSVAGKSVQSAAEMVEPSGAGRAGDQQKNEVLQSLKQEAKTLLRQTRKPELQPEELHSRATQAVDTATSGVARASSNPQEAEQKLDRTLDKLASQAQSVVAEVDREAAINVITARTGKSEEEAAQIVDGWIQKLQQAQVQIEEAGAEIKQEARQTGEAVAQGTAKTAFWGVLALLLGAAAAGVGGRIGSPKDFEEHPSDSRVA